MTRITQSYVQPTIAQDANFERLRQRKVRLRLSRRRQMVFRALQKSDMEHARLLREKMLAGRGIAKFSKHPKIHAHLLRQLGHHPLSSARRRAEHQAQTEHAHRRVERREQGRDQGGQQGGGDSNDRQQQGEQQEQSNGRSNDDEQAQSAEGVCVDGGARARARISAAAAAPAEIKPPPIGIQQVVAECTDAEHAVEAARLRYFDGCTAIWRETSQAAPSPTTSVEGLTDGQRRNLLLPLVLLSGGHPATGRQREDALDRNDAIRRITSQPPAIDKGIRPAATWNVRFAEKIRELRADHDLALHSQDVIAHTDFDHVKEYLSGMTQADVKPR